MQDRVATQVARGENNDVKLHPITMIDLCDRHRVSGLLSVALVLEVTDDERRTEMNEACVACAAASGDAHAAQQLGDYLEAQQDQATPSTKRNKALLPALEWFGLAAIGGIERAWSNVARVLKAVNPDDHAAVLESMLSRASSTDMHATYALGKLIADRGDHERAWVHVLRAAEAGLPDAMLLASHICNGPSASLRNHDESLRWLRAAAELGTPTAQTELGEAFLNGRIGGSEGNKAEAMRWFRKAASQSDARGQFLLGHAYEQSESDASMALPWLELAAGQGFAPAQVHLAHYHLRNEDEAAGVEWLEQAARSGDVDAQMELGKRCVEAGDFINAQTWLAMASNSGTHLEGCLAHAGLLLTLRRSDLAFAPTLAAARLGHAPSQLRAGRMLLGEMHDDPCSAFREPTEDELQKGADLVRDAALSGETGAHELLGDLYRRGRVFDVNLAQARHWLQVAIERGGSSRAAVLLASGYDNERSEEINTLLQKAADSGERHAFHTLGKRAFQFGEVDKAQNYWQAGDQQSTLELATRGLLVDASDRRAHIEAAARQGIPRAQRLLGRLLLDEDNVHWSSWIERAADGGDRDAQRQLAQCKNHPRRLLWQRRAAERDTNLRPDALAAAADARKVRFPSADDADGWNALRHQADSEPRAQYILALALLTRRVAAPAKTSPDQEARRWLRRASRSGSVSAILALAQIYEFGIGLDQPCVARARCLYTDAADQSSGDAYFALAMRFAENRGQALAFLQRGAALGHGPCTLEYASWHLATGATDLAREALQSMRATSPNHAHLLYLIARIEYCSGRGPRDFRAIADSAGRAAQQGHARAQMFRGELAQVGLGGVASLTRAQYYFRRAAATGLPEAHLTLARLSAQDTSSCYMLAAKLGDPSAIVRIVQSDPSAVRDVVLKLASLYEACQSLIPANLWVFRAAADVCEDGRERLRWLEIAGKSNCHASLYLLGRNAYDEGDHIAALGLWQRAGQLNNGSACLDLGLLYVTGGNGIESDWLKGRKFLKKAIPLIEQPERDIATQTLQFLARTIGDRCVAITNASRVESELLNDEATAIIQARDDDQTMVHSDKIREEVRKSRHLSFLAGCQHRLGSDSPLIQLRQDRSLLRLILDFDNDRLAASVTDAPKLIKTEPPLPDANAPVSKLLRRALALLSGDGVPRDPCAAGFLLQTGAARGSADCAVLLGHLYAAGIGVCSQPSPVFASYWYRCARERSPTHLTALLSQAATLQSCRADPVEIAALYRHAEDLGSQFAARKLTEMESADPTLKARVRRAVTAGAQDRSIAFLLGFHAHAGARSALAPLRDADSASSGSAPSLMRRVARHVIAMTGTTHVAEIPTDSIDMIDFLRHSPSVDVATQRRGFAECADDLVAAGDAILLTSSHSGDVNSAWRDAIRLYDSAARFNERPSAQAQFLLGNSLEVAQSSERALVWYRRAAQSGLPIASQWLGSMYATGRAVEKDSLTAYCYFRQAADQLQIIAPLSEGEYDDRDSSCMARRLLQQDPSLERSYAQWKSHEASERALALLLASHPRVGAESPLRQYLLDPLLTLSNPNANSTVRSRRTSMVLSLGKRFLGSSGSLSAVTPRSAEDPQRQILGLILALAGDSLVVLDHPHAKRSCGNNVQQRSRVSDYHHGEDGTIIDPPAKSSTPSIANNCRVQ